MEIDLNLLNKNNIIEIDETILIDPNIYKNSEIRDIPYLKVDGYLDNNYNINIKVKGIMVLPDSRTLEDIQHKFNFKIEEKLDENSEYFQKKLNKLDIIEFLWENIVLEIPIRITKDEEKPISLKGEGWELTDQKVSFDERLVPLRDLLDKGKE